MQIKWLFTFVFCFLPFAFLYSQLPDCDIWLLDIKDSAGKVSFHNPVNITNRKGYDNQPAFSPDGKYILYSSQRDSGGQIDIYKYDLNTKQTTLFMKTPESEYSPAFMHDGPSFSVSFVSVELDSTQRLWKYMPWYKAEMLVCLMDKIKMIGYYCWLNKDSVAIFVLTKPAFTLQIANIHTQKTAVIADSIGRCMRMHNGNLWYTTKAGRFWNVYEYSLKSKTSYIKGMIESEDFCFYRNEIWSVSDNALISGFMNSKAGATEILNCEKPGITKPARITVSPDGKKLAVVSCK
jgi:WD40 repeat protein